MEGTGSKDHYGRYTDSSAVVHIRLSEGLLPVAPPTSSRDAREPQEKTRDQETAIAIKMHDFKLFSCTYCSHSARARMHMYDVRIFSTTAAQLYLFFVDT